METPSVAAMPGDATPINEDVREHREKSLDATAIATRDDNPSDLEKTVVSSEKVEGQLSTGRVRTIRNGKVG
jgi:hypothetical protein